HPSRAAPPPADLCGSGVGGRPGEAAVSGPGALLHPAPLHHLAAPRSLQAGADTDAAESGRPEDDDLHVDLCRLSRASQPERLVLRVLPADQRGEQPPPPGHPHPHRPVRSQSNRGNAQHVGSRPRGQQRDLHLSERRQPACEPLHLVQSGRRRVDEDGEGQTLVLKVTQKDSGAHLCEARTQKLSQRSGPVTLEVSAATGSRLAAAAPYALCGVLLVVYMVTVVVDVYKYQSISGRLKRIELQVEPRPRSAASDYEQLQPRGPMTSEEAHNYENPIALRATYKNLPRRTGPEAERV
uniref:Uncharacterized protein n=1 Tax=Gasterosteus aculeatus aculeatus TaxID=481459 RepID=A0AAQ4RAX0_GASAC